MQPLTLRYQLESDEVAAASIAYSPAVRASARRTRALGGIGIVVGLLFLTRTPVAAALLAVGALIFGLGTRSSMVRRQRWFTARTPFLTDPVVAVADDDGVRFTTAHSDLWYRWSNYTEVRSTTDGIALVMRGGTTVRWIPARAFAGADQQAAWFAQARAGIDRSMAAAAA
jgi:hypothetical protein